MEKQSYISVFVRQMRVSVRIGLLEAEKSAPQALDVSVQLYAAPDYLDDDAIIDYGLVHDYILALESRPHTELLETLARDIMAFGFGFDAVTAVKLSISKPDIFDHAQQAGLELFMRRGDYKV